MSDGGWLGSPLGYLYQLTAAAGWTRLPFLPVIRQPALVVAGDDDPIIPLANARLMNLLIPRSRLHIYHGGHLDLATEAAELALVVDASSPYRYKKCGRGRRMQRGPSCCATCRLVRSDRSHRGQEPPSAGDDPFGVWRRWRTGRSIVARNLGGAGGVQGE